MHVDGVEGSCCHHIFAISVREADWVDDENFARRCAFAIDVAAGYNYLILSCVKDTCMTVCVVWYIVPFLPFRRCFIVPPDSLRSNATDEDKL